MRHFLEGKASKKKRGFRGPTCYKVGFTILIKAKKAQKLQFCLKTGPGLGGGGVRGTSAKSPSITFFKPSIIENGTKIVLRRVVLLELMFLMSLRTHESMEIQFSIHGIHQK